MYLCGVLAPAVIWLGRRRPIDSRIWKRSLLIHLAASILLTGVGVFVEGSLGWLPHAGRWSYWAALRHYFTQHTQISIVTYWTLLGAFHIYRIYDRERRREVHAAQLEAQLREAQLMALRNQLQPHQPLIENAIRYGIGSRKEPDVVTVRAFANEDRLHVEICNLTSALDAPLEKLLSRGVGLANTVARLQHLYDSKQSFVIRNLSPQGVKVSLSLPARPLPCRASELETYEHSGANR